MTSAADLFRIIMEASGDLAPAGPMAVANNVRPLLIGLAIPPSEAGRIASIACVAVVHVSRHWDEIRPLFDKD